MTEQEPRREMNRLEWGVIFSVLVSAASLIFSAGVIWTKVNWHDQEITALQAKDGATTDRLARIETKLDFIIANGEAKQ